MNNERIAKELLSIARELEAFGDRDVKEVARIVKRNKFLDLREPLTDAGYKADFVSSTGGIGGPYWRVRTRGGRTIAVMNKKYADPGPGDKVVGDFIVGYIGG